MKFMAENMNKEEILVALGEVIRELKLPSATKNPQVVIDRWASELSTVKDAVEALEIKKVDNSGTRQSVGRNKS